MKQLTDTEKQLMQIKAIAEIEKYLTSTEYEQLSEQFLDISSNISQLISLSDPDDADLQSVASAVYYLRQFLTLMRPFAYTMGQTKQSGIN